MSSWLVLGLGNPLSGADAFGPAVIDLLRRGPSLRDVALADAGTDLLGWIARFSEYEHVVLVDAVAEAAAAVEPHVAVVDERTFTAWNGRSPSVHEMSPLAAVQLLRALQRGAGGRLDVPTIHLVGLFVAESEFSNLPGRAELDAGVAAVRHLVAAS